MFYCNLKYYISRKFFIIDVKKGWIPIENIQTNFLNFSYLNIRVKWIVFHKLLIKPISIMIRDNPGTVYIISSRKHVCQFKIKVCNSEKYTEERKQASKCRYVWVSQFLFIYLPWGLKCLLLHLYLTYFYFKNYYLFFDNLKP